MACAANGYGLHWPSESVKAELPHGEWLKMIRDELPFGKRTAQMLVTVATNDNLQDAYAKHVSLLPAAWGTLYELTKRQSPPSGHYVASLCRPSFLYPNSFSAPASGHIARNSASAFRIPFARPSATTTSLPARPSGTMAK